MRSKSSGLKTFSGGKVLVASEMPEAGDSPSLEERLEELSDRVAKLEELVLEDAAKPDKREKHGIDANAFRGRRVFMRLSPSH